MPRTDDVVPSLIDPSLREVPRAIAGSRNERVPRHGFHVDHPAKVIVADVLPHQRAPHHGRLVDRYTVGAPVRAHVAIEVDNASHRAECHTAMPWGDPRGRLPHHVVEEIVDPERASTMRIVLGEAEVQILPRCEGSCHHRVKRRSEKCEEEKWEVAACKTTKKQKSLT